MDEQSRVPTSLSGRFKRPLEEGGTIETVSNIQNISVRGVFIERTEPVEIGQEISFEMILPRSGKADQVIEVVGIVRWIKDDDPGGIGVEFLEVR